MFYLKKNKFGGIYICDVYQIINNKLEHINNFFKDDLIINKKTGKIEISFGIGTGYSVISNYLKDKKLSDDLNIYDISMNYIK